MNLFNIKTLFTGITITITLVLSGCGGGGKTTSTIEESTQNNTIPSNEVLKLTSETKAVINTQNLSTTIEWELNKYATGQVEYGTTTEYGELSIKEDSFTYTKHTFILQNLQEDTLYHYRIISEDENGNHFISENYTFRTPVSKVSINNPVVTPAPLPEPIVEPTSEPVVTPAPIVEQTPEPTSSIEPTTSLTVIQKGQVKDNISGEGLENVKVSIGGQSTLTDPSGFYTLSNLSESQEAVVNFEKEGYLLGSTQIQLKASIDNNTESLNYLEFKMYKHDYQWDYESSEEIVSSRIAIYDSVNYIDINGNPYSGTISTKLTILDLDEEAMLTTFPGTYNGINTNGETVQFVSYGLITIFLSDTNGNQLSLAKNDTATLIFKSVSLTEKPSTLPLWYYDYEQGVWFEEGYAELQEDGTYKGDVSHLGTWSLNKPLENEPGIYRARIKYPDGTAAKNIRIQAMGTNWISSDLSTDDEGIFEIEVIPDSEFKLKAYDYENKFGATSATLPALTSGEVNEDRM